MPCIMLIDWEEFSYYNKKCWSNVSDLGVARLFLLHIFFRCIKLFIDVVQPVFTKLANAVCFHCVAWSSGSNCFIIQVHLKYYNHRFSSFFSAAQFLLAQCCANMVLAMRQYLCVCLSITCRTCCVDTSEQIEPFLIIEATNGLSYSVKRQSYIPRNKGTFLWIFCRGALTITNAVNHRHRFITLIICLYTGNRNTVGGMQRVVWVNLQQIISITVSSFHKIFSLSADLLTVVFNFWCIISLTIVENSAFIGDCRKFVNLVVFQIPAFVMWYFARSVKIINVS